MTDFVWGLQVMAVGMGVVFGLLFALWGLLALIGRLDRPRRQPAPPASAPPAPAQPAVTVHADGLDAETLAAIAVAVMTHAEIRRRAAAPEVRAARPGSQLFASRWLAVGRGHQTAPYHRR